MRKVRYQYIPSTRVITPFPLPCVSPAGTAGVPTFLSSIYPWKARYWSVQSPHRIQVDAGPAGPFGPTQDQWEGLLPAALPETLARVAERFQVEISVVGGAGRCLTAGNGNAERSRRGARQPFRISLYEFSLLAHVAAERSCQAGVPVSVFWSEDHVDTAIVPIGTPLTEVIGELRGSPAGDAESSSVTMFRALTGEALSPDCVSGPLTEHLIATDKYAVQPLSSGLLPFPFFNRPVGVLPKGRRPQPVPSSCANCLACTHYCPAELRPSLLYHNCLAEEEEEALKLGLERCTQCGVCSLVCPAGLPLTGQFSAALANMGGTES